MLTIIPLTTPIVLVQSNKFNLQIGFINTRVIPSIIHKIMDRLAFVIVGVM